MISSFKLATGEDAAEGLRRIFRKQLQNAARCLREDGRLTDSEIHDARKMIKRARATLRLLRPALAPPIFSETNLALRDVARPLSNVRDAKVLLDTIDSLLERDRRIDLDRLHPLLDELRSQRSQARRALSRATLRNVRGALRRLSEDARAWPLERTGWDLLEAALRKIYRRARRTGRALSTGDHSDEHLHEWRKQVKHLWYSLQLLTPSRPDEIGKLADLAHELTDSLGDDHDLAILGSRVTAQLDEDSRTKLLDLIRERRRTLQRRARDQGEELLAGKPKRFVGALEKKGAKTVGSAPAPFVL
jgi:CHAD domain-containing protein